MDELMETFDFTRHPDENNRQYIWRICSAKDDGTLDLSWQEVTDMLNEELYGDTELSFTESVYRKAFKTAKAYFEDVFKPMVGSSTILKQMEEQKIEIEKAAKRCQDQRREYKRYLTQHARQEHLHETIASAARQMPALFPLIEKVPQLIDHGDTEAVLFLNDWHYGMTTDNIWNKYNTQICRNRAGELVEKTIGYLLRHEVRVLHVALLGDACAGAIHVGTRVEAEEAVCEQLMHVSELLAEVIAEFLPFVDEINIYSTYGNHARTVQNKHDSIHRDNMERIIPWWLKERFADAMDEVNVIEQDQYGELIHIPVCGHNLIAAHGDLDRIRDMGTNFHTIFSQKYGLDVEYVVVGDKHHFENIERLGVDAMIVPAMCGTDEYAHTKRLYSDPAQVLMMFTPTEGRECVYTIKFGE